MSLQSKQCNTIVARYQDSKVGYEHDKTLEYSLDGSNLHINADIDTEYTHPVLDLKTASPDQLSPTITVQCRGVDRETGLVFAHLDIASIARHPVMKSGFAVVDYLNAIGHEAVLIHGTGSQDLPYAQFNLYSFFAVAELARVFTGEFQKDILKLCLKSENKGYGIDQGRRTRTYTNTPRMYHDWVELPWILDLDGKAYRVKLAWYDTSAVHGAVGYAGLCQNTNTPIPYKDTFTTREKGDMKRMYLERPDEFDNYALGDLYNHTALMNNIELFLEIYRKLGLELCFRNPRMTMGATVRDLHEASTAKLFSKVHPDKRMRDIALAYCKPGTAAHIKAMTTSTAVYNAKVDGGRCRNNRPTETVVKGVICDLDISSCYGEGLRVQIYPYGVPVIIDYPVGSIQNVYMTLREFRRRYGKELVPGLWQARVSTREEYRLKYVQDFLMSWFPPKDISKMPTASDFEETDEWWTEDNVGLLKMLTRQVNLAIINHDFLQWLDNIASARQREELLDNCLVVTAMYYPASERVDSPEALKYAHENHNGRNTCTVKRIRGKTTKISIHQECHKWYGVTLGDVLITKLIRERKKASTSSNLNQLMKLCINTTYGDMVSPYFGVGNVVVGNNITARARALAYYMEKGLHGHQTITDGCAFDVNRVPYPDKSRLNGENLVGLYRASTRNIDCIYKSIQGIHNLKLKTGEDGKPFLTTGSDADETIYDLNWVNKTALTHLQRLFPVVDVLHAPTTNVHGNARKGQFEFEAKGLYDTAVFHGSANYAFGLNDDLKIVKMRSYSKKPLEWMTSQDLEIAETEYYPSKDFLTKLMIDSSRVVRPSVYLKATILKIGDYSRHYLRKYEYSKVFPGMTVKQGALLREFSLAQFTYQDIDQYKAWERESEGLRRRYGQSYEMYFLNADDTLDYQLMVETIDRKISEGAMGFWNGRPKRETNEYRRQGEHPGLKTLKDAKQGLARYYNYKGVQEVVKVVEDDDGELFINEEFINKATW